MSICNKTDELPDTIPVNPADTAADTLEVGAKGVKAQGRRHFPRAPLVKNNPLPVTTPTDKGLFDYQPLSVPITPRRQVFLDILNYGPRVSEGFLTL